MIAVKHKVQTLLFKLSLLEFQGISLQREFIIPTPFYHYLAILAPWRVFSLSIAHYSNTDDSIQLTTPLYGNFNLGTTHLCFYWECLSCDIIVVDSLGNTSIIGIDKYGERVAGILLGALHNISYRHCCSGTEGNIWLYSIIFLREWYYVPVAFRKSALSCPTWYNKQITYQKECLLLSAKCTIFRVIEVERTHHRHTIY